MIRLERVTADNWRQVITLDIADDQRRFLETPSVLHAIAEVQFHPTYTAYAICDDETMVGFAIYGHMPEDHSKWWIPLFIIDHRHQGKGYGRGALESIIKVVPPHCREIALNYKPENTTAERLYLNIGFTKTDEIDERGQVTMRLKFGQPA
jgi:diamine N-acetyltransferase